MGLREWGETFSLFSLGRGGGLSLMLQLFDLLRLQLVAVSSCFESLESHLRLWFGELLLLRILSLRSNFYDCLLSSGSSSCCPLSCVSSAFHLGWIDWLNRLSSSAHEFGDGWHLASLTATCLGDNGFDSSVISREPLWSISVDRYCRGQ